MRRRAQHRPATRRMYPPNRPGGLCPPPPDRARCCLGPRLMRWQRPPRCRRFRLLTGPRRRAPARQATCLRRPRTSRRTPAGSSLRCRARSPTSFLPPAACGCCRPRPVARARRPERLAFRPRTGPARQPPARQVRRRAGPRPGPRPRPLLRLSMLPRLPARPGLPALPHLAIRPPLPSPQPLRRAPRAARPPRRRRPLLRPW